MNTLPTDIKVLVVDDSRLMRNWLSDLINASPKMSVMETARDGSEALRKIERSKPDVVILDLEMPKMDGLSFLEKIMVKNPVPVVVHSTFAQRGSQLLFDALDSGAVDFIPKVSTGSNIPTKLLYAKVASAAQTEPTPVDFARKKARKNRTRGVGMGTLKSSMSRVVIIGASTGGPRVIGQILEELPENLPACVVVVQHMPEDYTDGFAKHLDGLCALEVREAKDGDRIQEGMVLVAPGGFHVKLSYKGRIFLDDSEPRLGSKPSINVAMISAAEAYGEEVLGVLCSGMGHDGAFGMKAIKNRGGRTLAQDAKSSIVFGMAGAAAESKAVDRMVPASRLGKVIIDLVS